MGLLIGLIGFIGSGKGVAGDFLVEKGFHKDSFARPVKDAVSTIFSWPRELLEGDTELSRRWREEPDVFWSEKFGYEFTPRLALQLMGTEAGRNIFHPNIWVISLLNRAKGRDVVVTDVRFRNEIDYIQNHGGVVIRIARGKDPDWYYDLVKIKTDSERQAYMNIHGVHQSEWDWVGTNFDFVVHNNGTLSDLGDKLDEVLLYLKK